MARELRDSGISWIGAIPTDWDVRRVKNGFVRKNEKAMIEDPVVLSLARAGVRVRNMENAEGQFAESYYNYNPVEPGDLLLNPMDLYSGANCSISRVFGVISPAYMNLRAKKDYCAVYYDYFFKTQYWAMAMFAHGKGVSFDNRWTISAEDLFKYYIPYPSISEQQRIADFLDTECAQIEGVIEQTRTSIEEYKKLKQALITEAVTKGICKDRTMKDSGVEWIGEIPKEWSTFRIANLYVERTESGQDELPILSVSINTGISDHEVEDEEQTRVFLRSEDRTKYKRVYPGDLAYNMMRAWQGAFGAARVNGMVSPAYVVAKPMGFQKIDSRYMEALLRTPSAIEEMHRYSRGITDFRLRLYWPEFRNIRVCLPLYEEQVEIADFIDEQNSKMDHIIESKEKLLRELEAYKKSIIYEVVTGKKEVSA